MGKLIAVVAADACGKSTQVELIKEYLKERDLKFGFFHFPAYGDNEFSEMISKFLRGEYGSVNEVNPYFVANLYAMDRFMFLPKLQKMLEENDVVLLDRYVWCNMVYQGSKCLEKDKSSKYEAYTFDSKERDLRMQGWIHQLEFNGLKLPYPDLTLCLDVPFETMKKRLEMKRNGDDRAYLKGKEDIHEGDLELQRNVKNNYLNLVGYLNYRIVECGDKNPQEVFDSYVEYLDYVLNKELINELRTFRF